ncbi:Lipase 4 [Leucoagaricus sp. SymC.cos]|nr:Lipase 4 [Leucoagaricus sp. SymC.cos]
MLARLSTVYALCASLVAAADVAAPIVKLDSATVTGKASGSVQEFLGIPFAQPPVGYLRFQLPQPVPAYNGSITATAFRPACPQQALKLPILTGLPAEIANNLVNGVYSAMTPSSEDCLSINVVKPASATSTSKLPVVVWIFGGGFQVGGTSTYDGSGVVSRSIDMGQPIVFVSMNYRVTGFGFLASKEVKAAGVGNLGLQDQRQALHWVQKYIPAFGGDPARVTIWGESAGAVSASLHMIANDGNIEGLFRGAIMESGAPIPVGDIENGQIYYDAIVKDTGCSGSADTLQCLREVSFDKLKAAIDATPSIFGYQSLRLAWAPRADGKFLTDNPQRLVQNGKIAKIPYITGNCDDEGTLFSFSTLNLTTDGQFREYIKTVFLPGVTDDQANQLTDLYPADIIQGSPFGTGILNAITPQFKRIAAVQGDGVFQAPRRWLLQNTSGKQNIWVFLSKRFKGIPLLGSLHGSDLINSFFLGQEFQDYVIRFTNDLDPNEFRDYVIRFTNNLDPNGNGLFDLQWPKYTTANPKQLVFLDGLIPLTIQDDTYRKDQMNFRSADTLQCLREVSFDKLKAAIDATPSIFGYQSLRLAWAPRADGKFLTDNPQRLVQNGKIAKIPYITGNCDDEGTLFSFSTLNLTTDGQFREYIKTVFLPGVTDDQANQLTDLYPADIIQGSPFGTGILNAVTPQFKRIAAVQGDGVFQAPRRWLLQNTSGKQNIWVFLSKRFKAIPLLGSLHASDLINSFFLGQELRDYVIRFTNNLDPNGNGLFDFQWPKYTTANPKQLVFLDGLIPLTIQDDTYRKDQMDFLTQLTLAVPA